MDTCFAYGQNPSQLRERYHEAHDLILRAWTEDAPFTWNGRFNKQRYVNVWPRPLQKPHPPIWIPGGGSVETWRWCAERDYVYSLSLVLRLQARATATMRGFWDEMERLGKDRNPYRAGFLQFVGVAETREEALEALPRARRVLLRPLPAPRSALRDAARLHERGDDPRAGVSRWSARAARASAGGRRPRDDVRGDRRRGLRDRRQPRRGRRAAARGRHRV